LMMNSVEDGSEHGTMLELISSRLTFVCIWYSLSFTYQTGVLV
jgi:hypothetical protein